MSFSHLSKFSTIYLLRINSLLTPLLLGIISFSLVVGFQSVNPSNIAWLQIGDPAQHYYGWVFYRNGPWTWPIGLNPNFGGDLATSIVYTDSIPLLAIFLKAFSALLSESFQYLGFFIFACFVLQSIFGWLLVSLFTTNYWIRFCGTLLILFAPPMMGRTVMTTSLAAHFLVLASLYLALRKTQSRRIEYWATVLCTSALIHAYILGMVLAVWFGSCLDCYFKNKLLPLRKAFFEIVVIPIALGLTCWQAGYFAIALSSGAAGNYGLNGLDLLAFFDPNGWSYLLRIGTPYSFHSEDGLQFLGLGNILLCSFALIGIFRFGFHSVFSEIKKYSFLFLALLLLILFSLTQNVHIGHWHFHYWLPEILIQWASIFRASSRMVWPVWYVLVLVSVWIVVRTYSIKWVYFLLGFAIVIQIADTSAGWYPRKIELSKRVKSSLYLPLQNEFWKRAGLQYGLAERLPHLNTATGFEVIANFAQKYRMSTNAANFSRFNDVTMQQVNSKLDAIMSNGRYSANTIYFLEKSHVIASLAKIQESKDLLALVDGQYIIAPEWFVRNPQWQPSGEARILSRLLIGGRLHESILFNSQNPWAPLFLISGWAYPEGWGTWLASRDGSVNLLIPSSAPKSITLNLRPFLYPGCEAQEISVGVNGRVPVTYVIKNADKNLITIPLNAKDLSLGYVSIEMHSDSGRSPKDLGIGDDDRQLSIGLISATFN